MRIANRWVVQMESVDSPVASYLLFFFRMSAQRQETRGNTTKSLILKQYHMLSDYRFFSTNCITYVFAANGGENVENRKSSNFSAIPDWLYPLS